jgi:hypothetical protein
MFNCLKNLSVPKSIKTHKIDKKDVYSTTLLREIGLNLIIFESPKAKSVKSGEYVLISDNLLGYENKRFRVIHSNFGEIICVEYDKN